MSKRDRRSDIMEAAEKLFTGGRFEEVTLDEVVRRAGVGKGTVYRYFADKDDLFFQTAMHGLEELCELIRSSADGQASFPEQLLEACRQISSFFRRRRPLFRMMQGQECRMSACAASRRKQWQARRRELLDSLVAVLARGGDEGKIRRDIPPRVQAAFLLGMLRTRAREPELAELPAGVDLAVQLFLQGVGRGGQQSHEAAPLAEEGALR